MSEGEAVLWSNLGPGGAHSREEVPSTINLDYIVVSFLILNRF